jgi:hypothetical protein
VRYEVLKAVKMLLAFWAVTPCGLVGRYQRFGGTYFLHLQDWEMGSLYKVRRRNRLREIGQLAEE